MSTNRGQWDPMRGLRQYSEDIKAFIKLGAGLAIVVVGAWLVMSSFYTVESRERAVILRLGKDVGVVESGLHFKLPFGIDRVKKVAVEEVKREEFGFRTEEAGVETRYAEASPEIREEGRILTGDLNILAVEWVVRYRVDDIRKYFFNLREPSETIRDVSESVMRQIIGDSSVDEVITFGRERIQMEAQELIQTKLTEYDAGIDILDQGGVRMKDVSPPDDVKAAFDEVNKARQRKETIINEGESERNSKIPEAEGKKQRVIDEAKGYASERINEATGDVARFKALMKAHEKAPEVMEKRLYLETMRNVMQNVSRKYVLDSGATDVLKFLDLDKSPMKGDEND